MSEKSYFLKKTKNKKKSWYSFFLILQNSLIGQDRTQKHLALTLAHKLTFQYHLNEKIKKSRERNWSSSNATVYFPSNIFTDYLQIVYKTTFELQ